MAKKGGLGFGIVGCGMVAHYHALAVSEMRGGHLACVYSRQAEKTRAYVDQFGCTAYTDYGDFLRHPGLDVVTIATPSGAHLEPAAAAAAAGKHVICEKPLEVTLERVDRMVAACEANGVVLAGIFPRRFLDATQVFKKAVEGGRFGRLTLAGADIKWYRDQDYYDSGEWRGTWALDGGGALMNQGIHTIDLLLHLAGEVESVCAFADRRGHERIEVEDVGAAVLRFASGALGTIEGSTACYAAAGNAAEVQLTGTDGTVFMHGDTFRTWDFRRRRASDAKVLERFGAGGPDAATSGAARASAMDHEGHRRNFEDTARAIAKGVAPAVDGREARRAIEVILAIYRSALAGGKRVDLPLKKTPPRRSFR